MNLPEKFLLRMKNMLGEEYDGFVRAMETAPVFSGIRINNLKKDAHCAVKEEFGSLEHVEWCADGYYADKSLISGNHPYHIAGLFYFQEPSAMSAVAALPVQTGDYVLDLCAAPGGKATQAGALLGGEGVLVANEIVRGRANILADNIERMGIGNAVVTNETPQRLAEKYPRFFDKIIVDAPCSGEGMFRKEPLAAEEWRSEHTVSCGIRQRRILDSAVKMLRGGGYLVYSTCTFAPEENEKVCAYLLENYNLEMAAISGLSMLESGRSEWSDSVFDMRRARRIYPHRQKGEGHFVALFRSLEARGERTAPKPAAKCAGETLYREFEKEFLNTKFDGEFCLFGENLYLKPRGIDVDKIKTVRAGLLLGACRKNRFIPSHALCLALRGCDFKSLCDFDCGSAELKQYLSGETLQCEKKGWCAVTVNGYPIGWGKASGGVMKNHFPKHLRLR